MKYVFAALVLIVSIGLWADEAKTSLVWLDVRSAEEFAQGHIDDAINIPHSEIAQRITELNLDKSTSIALYCKSGRRAGIALEALQQLGYSNVTNEGGYEAVKEKLAGVNERK